jgi:hypothetical protein
MFDKFDDLHTIIIVPNSLKTAALNVIKNNIDPENYSGYFQAPLYASGSNYTTASAWMACGKIPIWARIKLEVLINNLNNPNVFVGDINLHKNPAAKFAIWKTLGLVEKPFVPPGG